MKLSRVGKAAPIRSRVQTLAGDRSATTGSDVLDLYLFFAVSEWFAAARMILPWQPPRPEQRNAQKSGASYCPLVRKQRCRRSPLA